MTNSIPQLETILKYNDALLGLPALPLVLIGCIMAGYMVKLIPVVSNRWIPAIVFACGITANLLITPLSGREGWVRAFILGMVAAGAALFIHRKWLRNCIDVDIFSPKGNTEIFANPENKTNETKT